MRVRLTQIDGALPNLALMRLASWHRARGHEVHVTRQVERDLFEPAYDSVFASVLFDFSAKKVARFRKEWPDAIVGGTGSGSRTRVESLIGEWPYVDYDGFPEFKPSLGYTQRGCRMNCKFCSVPVMEGKPVAAGSIAQIWRGEGHPKNIHLLDNDFFGGPEWRERIAEIRAGGFHVSFTQGINIRLINDETAEALASVEYRDTKFGRRRLYTAWDNLKDEGVFFRGVDRLERAGVRTDQLMAYMLIGFDPSETWERIWHRFKRMVARDIRPYPMVFDRSRKDLLCFQRWVVTGLYRRVAWPEYERATKTEESVIAYQRAA